MGALCSYPSFFSKAKAVWEIYELFLIKRIVIFRTKGEAGVFREAVMTLAPLIPGALHAHLDLHPGSTEHLSHSPGTLGAGQGKNPGIFLVL